MSTLTRKDVTAMLGELDDVVVAERTRGSTCLAC